MIEIPTREELEAQVCGTRVQHTSPGRARRHAQKLREENGPGFASWPCPFADPGSPHWHAGEVPDLESMEVLAHAMRGLPDESPHPHEPPPRDRRRRTRKDRP